MKNKKQITIIIPVYNCKNYLAECFDSIVNQTIGLDKLDIIIVDDGSTDGSDEVIKEYKKQYPDWKVISQKNAGLAAARNAALGHLETEYVCFFDSDDILPKTALSDLLKSAEKNKSDIVIGGMGNFTSAGHHPNYTTKYLKHFDQISYKKYIHLLDFVHACGKLYRVSIIKNKRFIAGTKHEDNYFTLSLYLSTDKISMIDKTVYCRRDREGNDKSITQTLDSKSFNNLLTNYGKTLDENEYNSAAIKTLIRKSYHYIAKEIKEDKKKESIKKAKRFYKKYIVKCNASTISKKWLTAYSGLFSIVCSIYPAKKEQHHEKRTS